MLDFGSFPGSSITSVDVAATGVISTSAVEAWIRPVASADHSVEDHVIVPMKVTAQYLSDNNIRIWGVNTNDVQPPLESLIVARKSATSKSAETSRQNAPMLVGQYNVWWVWN